MCIYIYIYVHMCIYIYHVILVNPSFLSGNTCAQDFKAPGSGGRCKTLIFRKPIVRLNKDM